MASLLIEFIGGLVAVAVAIWCLFKVSRGRKRLIRLGIWYQTLATFEVGLALLFSFTVWHALRQYLRLKERVGGISEYPEYIFMVGAYLFFWRTFTKIAKAVEEVERIKGQLAELSITDELTGLFNRRYFDSALDMEVNRAERYNYPLSLVVLDIDHFKEVNDRYGHDRGDEVLKAIGSVMAKVLRRSDVATRYGGEEFAAILPMTDMEGALAMAERIREEVASLSFLDEPSGDRFRVTISGGVAQAMGSPIDKRKLFADADSALYKAKATGRNRICRP